MRVAIITNIPTHYRDPVYALFNDFKDIESKVFFCSKSEPNRNWRLRSIEFDHEFLSKNKNKFIHFNFNIFYKLKKYNPDVVMTAGFNPTMLFAWFWTILSSKKHISFSDANIHSERNLSIVHKYVRKIVFKYSNAFLGASEGTLDLYRSYKIPNIKLFKSCLAIDNKKFKEINEEKEYDLMFCGQFIDRKQPFFFCELAKAISESKPELKVLLLGNGPLKEDCLIFLNQNNINYTDPGFVQPDKLPYYFNRVRLFLFPTLMDPWGLVANEALASGVPILISSVAGAANELVINGYNGFVLKHHNLESWVIKIHEIFNDYLLAEKLSLNAVKSVEEFTFRRASIGIHKAVLYSTFKSL